LTAVRGAPWSGARACREFAPAADPTFAKVRKWNSRASVRARGAVHNSGGTLFASGASSLIEIVSGAVVSGGLVEVGNGTIEAGPTRVS